MEIVWTILLTIVIFGALILIHEFGHYICARIFKVRINEFAIGFGPKLLTRVSKKTGIRYSLRAFPIGGFVSMEGEEGEADVTGADARPGEAQGNQPVAEAVVHYEAVTAPLNEKKAWQRLIIDAAGGTMNLVLGLILMTVYVASLGTQYFGNTTIAKFDEGAISEQSGLRVGDCILEIDGHNTYTSNDVVYEIYRNATGPIDIVVRRDGKKVTVTDVEFPSGNESGVKFGELDFYVTRIDKNILTVMKQSLCQSRLAFKMVIESVIDLVSGRYGIEAVSGPVGTGQVIGDAAKRGGSQLLYLCTLISINLGIFNLLPIPALDGFHMLFDLIELVYRRPSRKAEAIINFVGLGLLMLLMVVITFKDIFKIFVK